METRLDDTSSPIPFPGGRPLPRSLRDFTRKLKERRGATLGLWLIIFWLIAGLGADLFAPYPPDQLVSPKFLHGPLWSANGSISHILGTDAIGRDLLSRLLYGARSSLAICLIVGSLATLIGVTLGQWAARRGGVWDIVIMRVVDCALAFPALFVALLLVEGLSHGLSGSLWLSPFIWAMVATSLVAMAPIARMVRTLYLHGDPLKVRATRRQVRQAVLVMGAFAASDALLTAAALGFLGYAPTAPEWGAMAGAHVDLFTSQPWLVLAPCLCLASLALAIHQVADSLREMFAPNGQLTWPILPQEVHGARKASLSRDDGRREAKDKGKTSTGAFEHSTKSQKSAEGA